MEEQTIIEFMRVVSLRKSLSHCERISLSARTYNVMGLTMNMVTICICNTYAFHINWRLLLKLQGENVFCQTEGFHAYTWFAFNWADLGLILKYNVMQYIHYLYLFNLERRNGSKIHLIYACIQPFVISMITKNSFISFWYV